MNTIHVHLIGRFGNQMFQYAWARAYAEKHEDRLITNEWVGEQIFDLPHHGETEHDDPITLPTEYRQDQDSLIYTRKQVKEWFRFKPEWEEFNQREFVEGMVCHRRVGDYAELGYVVVSEKSYIKLANKLGYEEFEWICEEKPGCPGKFPEHLSFMPDFIQMLNCEVLARGNSSFSWWAATLGNAKVYSPVIEGLEGGKEQDCKFVEGNWPRFANLPFVTDLHLKEE